MFAPIHGLGTVAWDLRIIGCDITFRRTLGFAPTEYSTLDTDRPMMKIH